MPLAILLSLFLSDAAAAAGQAPAPDLPAIERQLDRLRDAVARERTRLGPEQRADLDGELRLVEDEVAYLRVRARRGHDLPERERREVADRLNLLMQRVGSSGSSSRGGAGAVGASRTVPAGTEIDVRLQTAVSSKTATVEQRVTATTMVDLYQGDTLVIPAGSRIEGHVATVDPATRVNRRGSLGLRFDRVIVDHRAREARLSVTQALEGEGLKGDAGQIGAGAGVGAILGGILGGVRGALAGMVIGGGGVVLATEGNDVDLPAGTVLRLRFDDAFAAAP